MIQIKELQISKQEIQQLFVLRLCAEEKNSFSLFRSHNN